MNIRRREKYPNIGIWGPTGAGKTTYLVGMYLEMMKDNWAITALESEQTGSQQFITQVTNSVIQGQFPEPTDDGKLYRLHFRRDKMLFLKEEFELTFIDAPGQIISGRGGEGTLAEDYFEYLADCDGILIMIDPDAKYKHGIEHFGDEEENYYTVLQRLIHYLTPDAKRPSTHLAFCITKIDRDEYWEYRHKPEDFLEAIVGQGLYKQLKNQLGKRMKTFAVSVVGRYRTPSQSERPNIVPIPGINRYHIANTGIRQPYNILAPILWLLDRAGR